MATQLWLHFLFAHGTHICLARPPCLFVHFLQPALGKTHDPFCGSLCCLEGVVKTEYTDGLDRNFITFFLKCQVTITWLGFKTLFTKVSWWPFQWRCLPGFTADDTILIDSPLFTVKDRCISTCQVKTNKSIALYQAGWQTTPCLLSSQAFPSLGPQKKMYIHQKSTKTTYQTLAMRTSRPPTRWQLKCVLGL